MGIWTHKTHHGPDSGGSHHLTPYSVLCVRPQEWHPNVTFSGTPGTLEMESRSCPECVPVGLPGLWTAITSRPDLPDLGSGRGLNQYCSPCWDLSNDVSHSPSARQVQVGSRLLVVGSQTANLTPGPSFAHNLGCRCPNDQCKTIFDIYASRTFQWHQEHPNARCFEPCCRTLNIRESLRTPSPQLWECWASRPHLANVGLRHDRLLWYNGFVNRLQSLLFKFINILMTSTKSNSHTTTISNVLNLSRTSYVVLGSSTNS
jgi:hypothetical protein